MLGFCKWFRYYDVSISIRAIFKGIDSFLILIGGYGVAYISSTQIDEKDSLPYYCQIVVITYTSIKFLNLDVQLLVTLGKISSN